MLKGTQDVLKKAMDIRLKYGHHIDEALSEAFSDEFGFGSTDNLTYDVLCELHLLGFLLTHKIER